VAGPTHKVTTDLTESNLGLIVPPMATEAPTDHARLLSERGVRVTAQRLAVLRAVSSRPHATADDIEEMVRADIGAISRQSVYDTLGTLTMRA
jgi:Fe2+ or Zn2+ uptake regulation protein